MERTDDCTMISFDFMPEAVVVGGGDFPSHMRPLSLLNEDVKSLTIFVP